MSGFGAETSHSIQEPAGRRMAEDLGEALVVSEAVLAAYRAETAALAAAEEAAHQEAHTVRILGLTVRIG